MSGEPEPKGKPFGNRLDGYVEVKDRIAMFYAAHPDGRLVTDEVRATDEPDGVPRVWVKALAYRTADDPHPGVGWSWMLLPGTTPYTRGSELENTETSAWGRAIGSLGIGIDKGIASRQEVMAKGGNEAAPDDSGERIKKVGPRTLTGKVARGSGRHSDLMPRMQPDGHLLGFRLELADGKAIPQVIATGPTGTALTLVLDELLGSEVTVTGEAVEVSAPGRKAYGRLYLDVIEGPFGRIPANIEAESIPLFSPEEEAAIDAALATA